MVFVATPQRGSYFAGSWISHWVARFITLPLDLSHVATDLVRRSKDEAAFSSLGQRMPTAVDNMTPGRPFIKTLASLPIAPGVAAHSIIAVKGDGPETKRAQILSMLCEGSSMRSISRVVDVSINTVTRYLVLAGQACATFHDNAVRGLKSERVQCDEIWSFCGMKEKTAKAKGTDRPAGVGDVWTWTAIDADTKLIVTWLLGGRDAGYAYEFMQDVADRLSQRVQLTTDGHGAYLNAVRDTFGREVDYAQLVKVYGPDPREDQRRYSPAQCLGAEKQAMIGNPATEHISTSYIERSNLTLRMANRRFTRLTNAFSKKLENHGHMIALYTVWYNFVKMHKSIRMSPALAAGVADKLWSMDDLVALVDTHDAAQPRKRPGRKPKAS